MDVASSAPRIGDYELLAKLGEGGMGAVYKARQRSLDRIVALKVLPPKAAEDAEYLQRFFREARATARLNHPNIVKGITVGTVDGYHIFAMEFVEGTNLKKRITQHGCLSEDEVVVIGSAISSALAHAHAAGIIHRDVKPENILMDRDGTPKLADLGLVSMHGDGSLTQAGFAVGTPHYMAPEQVRGEKDIDGRADIYSLGCTLYHAATGKTPFEAPTPGVLMVKHLNEKMPHPQAVQPELTDDFCQVLEHMVARRREDRYPDMQAAAKDLEALLEGEPIHCGSMLPAKSNFLTQGKRMAGAGAARRPTRPATAAAAPEARATLAAQITAAANDPRLRWILVAGVALISLLLTVAAMKLIGGSPESDEPRPGPEKKAPDPSFPKTNTDRGVTPRPVEYSAPPAVPAEPAKPLFNGRDLTGWSEQHPRWVVDRGELVGSADTENAVLACQTELPGDFELSFTASCRGAFHLAFAPQNASPAGVMLFENGAQVALSHYYGASGRPSRELAAGPVPRVDRPRQFRLTVKGSLIQVQLDGTLVASTREGVPGNGQAKVLSLYAHRYNETRFRDIAVREISRTSVR